jgi:hypothetical protein
LAVFRQLLGVIGRQPREDNHPLPGFHLGFIPGVERAAII